MAESPDIPPDLFNDLVSGNGRVTLIIGAGCSKEPPTNLPLSTTLSRRIHDRLLDDSILQEPCNNPKDLSEVADAVFHLENTQKPLVDRMERQDFIGVTPNSGHKIAAALMREGIVSSVITLNYDDAMTQAIGEVGGGSEISEISGPEAHGDLSAFNLVYLHRKADAHPDHLIMRTTALEEEWKGGWEEMIVQSHLIRPSSVFAGLGSPAAVLTESVKKIRQAVGGQSTFYQVDPAQYEGDEGKSAFTEALEIAEEQYIRMGWCDFMEVIGNRVRRDQVRGLSEACVELALTDERQHFGPLNDEERGALRRHIHTLFESDEAVYSFMEMGKLRACWFLATGSAYFPHSRNGAELLLAQLVLAVHIIKCRYGFEVAFSTWDGCAIFRKPGGRTVIAHLAHGRNRVSWSSLDTDLPKSYSAQRERTTKPTCVIGEGLRGHPTLPSPPRNIANPDADVDPEGGRDIMEDPALLQIEAYHLHEQTDVLDQIFA